MIKTPDLAREIIRSTKKGCRDWANGITLEEAGVHPDIIAACVDMRPRPLGEMERLLLPVSVKTRIGYDEVVAEEWTHILLEEEPAAISMHGRTLKQMYTGKADWEALSKAAKLTKDSPTFFLGNGDVTSMSEGKEKIKKYGVDGVLVGRAVFGNPWFFGDHIPTTEERLAATLEHSEYLEKNFSDQPFFTIRKHLAWYCQGFSGAKTLRAQLMKAESAAEVKELLQKQAVLRGLR